MSLFIAFLQGTCVHLELIHWRTRLTMDITRTAAAQGGPIGAFCSRRSTEHIRPARCSGSTWSHALQGRRRLRQAASGAGAHGEAADGQAARLAQAATAAGGGREGARGRQGTPGKGRRRRCVSCCRDPQRGGSHLAAQHRFQAVEKQMCRLLRA